MSTDPGSLILWLNAPIINPAEYLMTTPRPAHACSSKNAPSKLTLNKPDAGSFYRMSPLQITNRGIFLCTSWNSFSNLEARVHTSSIPHTFCLSWTRFRRSQILHATMAKNSTSLDEISPYRKQTKSSNSENLLERQKEKRWSDIQMGLTESQNHSTWILSLAESRHCSHRPSATTCRLHKLNLVGSASRTAFHKKCQTFWGTRSFQMPFHSPLPNSNDDGLGKCCLLSSTNNLYALITK